MTNRRAHLNLIDSSQQLFELDTGATIERGDGWMFGAGRSPHPVISNAVFRSDDALDPGELIERAQTFFAVHERGFALWARANIGDDRDLIEVAEEAGMRAVFDMPEMVLHRRVEEGPRPEGIELSRVESAVDARDYWEVAARAYASNGFPPEVFAYYDDDAGFHADNVAAFLARLDGRPVGISMTIVSHGVAGIYWVGCTSEIRGKGLGWTMTATAVNAGLEMGGEIASLQASPMGEGLYRRMGFETAFNYRLLHLPPEPRRSSSGST